MAVSCNTAPHDLVYSLSVAGPPLVFSPPGSADKMDVEVADKEDADLGNINLANNDHPRASFLNYFRPFSTGASQQLQ